jgi:glycosyltransferase involved in cell wall biosynthesis
VADCLVSAHRSEGWGLTISDAMACGNLVVAIAHGGNMEYMDAGNSLPVACSVERIRDDDVKQQPQILTGDLHWAYVDLDDLERQMRRALDERESLRQLGAQARRDMERFTPERVAAILEERLANPAIQ